MTIGKPVIAVAGFGTRFLPATKVCKTDRVLVHEIQGERLTTGDPLNFLKATVHYALRHPEIDKPFGEFLRSLPS